jgi:geranylgeranyl diphosphate synthase type I
MSLLNLQQRLLPLIETALKDYIDSLEYLGGSELKNMITYHMGWHADEADSASHGKRLRPLLLLLCTEALHDDILKALPAAISIELLHNFTLIHDDIEDRSPIRHGRPTLWKKWGTAQAINAGDALFSIAQMSMLYLRETCDENIAAESSWRLNQTCVKLTKGQHKDLSFENEETIPINAYLKMIKGKTAALISLSTNLGGLISGQSKDIQQYLAEFGECLGLAFQIQDDGLGIWGNPEITGKSVASDIQTCKKTLPILYGLKHNLEFKKMWEKQDFNAEDVAQMAEVLEACGAKNYIQSQTIIYTEKALTFLDRIFTKKSDEAQALFELSEKLLDRRF